MQQRRFGKTQLSVSEVGFGCARIGGVFQGSRSGAVTLLRRAMNEGITLFDTADMYAQGDSERLLGEAFQHNRHQVVIATKFGYCLPPQKRLGSRIKPLLKPIVARLGLKAQHIPTAMRGNVSRQDFSSDYIERAVEESLRRLKTDYIDLYQLHSPPAEILERGDFIEVLERLKQAGKLRYWGVACETSDDALRCLRLPSLASVQVGFSALEQAALDAAIPQAARHDVAIIARQVYASGLLTRHLGTVQPEAIADDPVVGRRKLDQLAAYASIAEGAGRSRAEMALKFALGESGVATVLLGMSRMEQLYDNLRSLRAPQLTEHERQLVLNSRRSGR